MTPATRNALEQVSRILHEAGWDEPEGTSDKSLERIRDANELTSVMTPIERVKAAWATSNRDIELNRVVEAMAKEGVTRDGLDEALKSLLLEVRAAGADDETEEIINCVGDRLHGWCHRSEHIHTLPSATGSSNT